MAVTGTLNLVKGSGGTLTDAGWTINQTAYFSGLTGDGTAAGLISEAYGILLNAGYYIGAFLHISDDGWPVVLDQIDFSLLTKETQEVKLIWRSRRYAMVRANFTTSAAMEQTNMDYTGTPLSVTYTYPGDYPEAELRGKKETTGAMVNKLIPETTIEISRTEWGPTYGYPAGFDISPIIAIRKLQYEGKINDEHPFFPIPEYIPSSAKDRHIKNRDLPRNVPIAMKLEGVWLLTAINAVTNDAGVTYDVNYSFAFRKRRILNYTGAPETIDGWASVYAFVDPGTGRPIPNPDTNSMKVAQIYEKVDFTNIWS